MSDDGKNKDSFGLQVTALVLVLLICVLCFPMPGGGLLITRLSGTEYVPETPPAASPLPPEALSPSAVFVPVVPPLPVAPPDPDLRFNDNLPIFSPENDPLAGPYIPGDSNIPAWIRHTVEGKTVWLDTKSYMGWGPRLDLELSGMSQDDLDLAKSACEKETPIGSWALPTAAEFDMAKVNGVLREDADMKHRWLTWQQVPPALVIPSVRGYVPASAGEKYSVRCIGRTLGAPMDGYLTTDNETTLKALGN